MSVPNASSAIAGTAVAEPGWSCIVASPPGIHPITRQPGSDRGPGDDWPTYDRVMAEERRTAVLVTPERTRP